eukprot:SAG11_NODE_3202_length_2612_cov_235.175418_3_plen_281_part_00
MDVSESVDIANPTGELRVVTKRPLENPFVSKKRNRSQPQIATQPQLAPRPEPPDPNMPIPETSARQNVRFAPYSRRSKGPPKTKFIDVDPTQQHVDALMLQDRVRPRQEVNTGASRGLEESYNSTGQRPPPDTQAFLAARRGLHDIMGQGRTNVDIDNVLGATLSQSPTMVAASSRRALNQERRLRNKRERILALEDRAEPNSKRANNRETIEINDRRTQEKRALEPDIESQISVRSAPTEDVGQIAKIPRTQGGEIEAFAGGEGAPEVQPTGLEFGDLD